MKQIKFRAWHKKEKEMSKFSFTDNLVTKYDKDDLHICSNSGGWNFYDVNLVIMQFTGFKDKRGREIYEEDIVETTLGGYDGVGGKVRTRKDLRTIEWHDGGFAFNDAPSGKIFGGEQIEIVGNKFENPEIYKKVVYDQASVKEPRQEKAGDNFQRPSDNIRGQAQQDL